MENLNRKKKHMMYRRSNKMVVRMVSKNVMIRKVYEGSIISRSFSFPTTIPDVHLSPKRGFLNFFYEFLYFALGSLVF